MSVVTIILLIIYIFMAYSVIAIRILSREEGTVVKWVQNFALGLIWPIYIIIVGLKELICLYCDLDEESDEEQNESASK